MWAEAFEMPSAGARHDLSAATRVCFLDIVGGGGSPAPAYSDGTANAMARPHLVLWCSCVRCVITVINLESRVAFRAHSAIILNTE